MKEFRVEWTECPTAYSTRKVLFVEAENADDANEIARDYVERKYGIARLKINEVTEAERMPAGRVLE